jgi:hypothetical protein
MNNVKKIPRNDVVSSTCNILMIDKPGFPKKARSGGEAADER